MVSFTGHYNAISISGLSQKLKLEKAHGALIILLYVSPSSPPLKYWNLKAEFAFLYKNTKKQPLFSQSLVEK